MTEDENPYSPPQDAPVDRPADSEWGTIAILALTAVAMAFLVLVALCGLLQALLFWR